MRASMARPGWLLLVLLAVCTSSPVARAFSAVRFSQPLALRRMQQSPAAGTCTDKPTAAGTTYSFPDTCRGWPEGSSCLLRCNAGFVLARSPPPAARCVGGSWQVPDISDRVCIPAVCSEGPASGSNIVWPASCAGLAQGARCTGSCAAGFFGVPVSVCQAGSFSAPEGGCTPSQCMQLPADSIKNAGWPSTCVGKPVGQACIAVCANGFDGYYSSVCQADGTYGKASGSCQSSRCGGSPPFVALATWPSSCTNASAGTSCVAACPDDRFGSPVSTCVGGSWTVPVGNCETLAYCPGLPSDDVTMEWPAVCNNQAVGQSCTGSCSNSAFSGTPTSSCLKGGVWSMPIGECWPGVCSGLPGAAFETEWPESCANLTVGQTCQGRCSSSAYQGQPQAACLPGGIWSQASGCSLSLCQGRPDVPADGFGERATFPSCANTREGYLCVASCVGDNQPSPHVPFSVCGPAGQWQPVQGDCTNRNL